MRTHRPPSTCPVCSESLITLRLGCPECGTELSGHFDTCRFCRLSAADLGILEVFLRSRGNIRDVQAHLEVSYPTARARLIEVLDRLGMAEEPAGPAVPVDPGQPEAPGASEASGQSQVSGASGQTHASGASGRAGVSGVSGQPAVSVEPADVGAVLADLAAGTIDVEQAEALLRRPG